MNVKVVCSAECAMHAHQWCSFLTFYALWYSWRLALAAQVYLCAYKAQSWC